MLETKADKKNKNKIHLSYKNADGNDQPRKSKQLHGIGAAARRHIRNRISQYIERLMGTSRLTRQLRMGLCTQIRTGQVQDADARKYGIVLIAWLQWIALESGGVRHALQRQQQQQKKRGFLVIMRIIMNVSAVTLSREGMK